MKYTSCSRQDQKFEIFERLIQDALDRFGQIQRGIEGGGEKRLLELKRPSQSD